MTRSYDELAPLIREALATATEAPWYFDQEGCCYSDTANNPPVLEPEHGTDIIATGPDQSLIALSREFVPAALAENARLRRLLRETLDDMELWAESTGDAEVMTMLERRNALRRELEPPRKRGKR